MTTAFLSTTYFGPIQWYQKLHRYDQAVIDRQEAFMKQTFRNRCLIATTQGTQALTVPVVHDSKSTIADVLISAHGNWRHLHWQALQSAYGESPFFEYYEDDLRPFFTDHRWERLIDYNDAICRKMCELLDIHPDIAYTDEYVKTPVGIDDLRNVITPKHPQPDPDFQPRPYYQVYRQKHGFLPNLSILDLLCNMGPESVYYL
jgi:hypothetical protein